MTYNVFGGMLNLNQSIAMLMLKTLALPYLSSECQLVRNVICRLQSSNTFTGASLHENSEASAELTTANGRPFTLRSARVSSQSHCRLLDL